MNLPANKLIVEDRSVNAACREPWRGFMALTEKLSGRPPAAVPQPNHLAGVRIARWNIW